MCSLTIECNCDTCAYKVLVQVRAQPLLCSLTIECVLLQGQYTERCDVHNHYYHDGYFAVNEAGRRLHDDASLLPMESFPGILFLFPLITTTQGYSAVKEAARRLHDDA